MIQPKYWTNWSNSSTQHNYNLRAFPPNSWTSEPKFSFIPTSWCYITVAKPLLTPRTWTPRVQCNLIHAGHVIYAGAPPSGGHGPPYKCTAVTLVMHFIPNAHQCESSQWSPSCSSLTHCRRALRQQRPSVCTWPTLAPKGKWPQKEKWRLREDRRAAVSKSVKNIVEEKKMESLCHHVCPPVRLLLQKTYCV